MNPRAKYQVFTPRRIVLQMLNLAGYRGNVVGKRVLEHSFGDGAFLKEIVSRYVRSALKLGFSSEQVAQGLSRDIVGYEIDAKCVNRARKSLDDIVASFGVRDVEWDLRCADYLFDGADDEYHWIIGNPPYLEYKDIGSDYRSRLKGAFSSCSKGKFDYCYAFLEASVAGLVDGGVLVQIVPGSIFKNVSAEHLRSLMEPGITHVVDFAGKSVFDGALVSPCVIKYQAGKRRSSISYRKCDAKGWKAVRKDGLGPKWLFSQGGRIALGTRRFGDLFQAKMPVATLCNDAFLLEGAYTGEEEAIRAAAAPRAEKLGLSHSIIFPYSINPDGTVLRFDEHEFTKKFPACAAHLFQFKDRLKARNADGSAHWFEYGRSQGLSSVPMQKLLLSTVVTGEVSVYELSENVVPYAGIVIVAKTAEAELSQAKAILESDAFFDYALAVGTSVSGSSVRITSSDINEYRY